MIKEYTTLFKSVFFNEINTFIEQEGITRIKGYRKYIDNFTKDFDFKWILLFLNFLYIKESWKKCHGFIKNMKQHNCVHHW